MILLFLGLIIFILLLIYFYICEIKASVFKRLGFVSNEINLDKISFNKHFHINIM